MSRGFPLSDLKKRMVAVEGYMPLAILLGTVASVSAHVSYDGENSGERKTSRLPEDC